MLRNVLRSVLLGKDLEVLVQKAAAAVASVGWSSYDGSNNGSEQEVAITIEGNAAAYVDADTVMTAVDYSAGIRIYLTDITGVTLGTPSLAQSITASSGYRSPVLLRMTATRYLLLTSDSADGGNVDAYLLDETGATVASNLATGLAAETSQSVLYPKITRHSDTHAVYAYRDNSTNDMYIAAFDITGDSISVGTKLEAGSAATSSSASALTSLSATHGVLINRGSVFSYGLSGTTLSLSTGSLSLGSVDIGTTSAYSVDLIDLNNNHALLIYTDDFATGNVSFGVYGHVVTSASGTATPTEVTGQTQLSDTAAFSATTYQNRDGVCAIPVNTTGGHVDQVMFGNGTGADIDTILVEIEASTYALAANASGQVSLGSAATGIGYVNLAPIGEEGIAYVSYENTANSGFTHMVLAQ